MLDEFGGPGCHALDFQQFGLLLAALDARDIAALETPSAAARPVPPVVEVLVARPPPPPPRERERSRDYSGGRCCATECRH